MASSPNPTQPTTRSRWMNGTLVGTAVGLSVGAIATFIYMSRSNGLESRLAMTTLSETAPYNPISSNAPVSENHLSTAEAIKAPQEKRTIGGIEYIQFENELRKDGELPFMYALPDKSVNSYVFSDNKLVEKQTPTGFYVFSQVTEKGKNVVGMALTETRKDFDLKTTQLGDVTYWTPAVKAEEAQRLSRMSVPDSTPYFLIALDSGEEVLRTINSSKPGERTAILTGNVFRGHYVTNAEYDARRNVPASQPVIAQPTSAPGTVEAYLTE